MSKLVSEQLATCRHCEKLVVWHFDIDAGEAETKYGFWYDFLHMTEACGGPTGEPVEDMWHEPR